MLAMQKVLEYIHDHLRQELSEAEAAESIGYTSTYFPRIFKEYYGCSFRAFVARYRLQRAADEIRENRNLHDVWKAYGYSSRMNFSKAFTKEFGWSPKQFLESGASVPDMVSDRNLEQFSITVNYETIPSFVMKGRCLSSQYDMHRRYMDQIIWLYDHKDALAEYEEVLVPENGAEQFGIWTHSDDRGLYYIWGSLFEGDVNSCESSQRDTQDGEFFYERIPAGEYAVFRFEKGENLTETAYRAQMTACYAFHEWRRMNSVKANNMGCTFERYTKEYGYLYVPILHDDWSDVSKAQSDYYAANWLKHVRAYLTTPVTLDELAKAYHYSGKQYYRIFKTIFGITPMEYLIYSRARMVAKDMQNSGECQESVYKKYCFSSADDYKKAYARYEHAYIRNVISDDSTEASLYEYEELAIEPMIGYGRSLVLKGYEERIDIPTMLFYRLTEGFPEVQVEEKDSIRIAFVESEEECDGVSGYGYAVAKILTGGKYGSEAEIYAYLKRANKRIIRISGGKYGVFKIWSSNDVMDPVEKLKTLSKDIFSYWLQNKIIDWDVARTDFIKYEGGTVYYYFPVL